MLAITGGARFRGPDVRALDLRASVALTLAALIADNETRIADAWQIERGYADFRSNLSRLGTRLVVR